MRKKKKPQVPEQEAKAVPTAIPTTDARRRLLKRLATGGGVIAAGGMLPQKWTAPVVQSVVLPAHAAASPGDGVTPCDTVTCDLTYSDFARRDPPSGPVAIAGGDLDDALGGCPGLPVNSETKIRFTASGIPAGITAAKAFMMPEENGSMSSSKCVPVVDGMAEWQDTGSEVSTAKSSTGCQILMVEFTCNEGGCGDFAADGGSCEVAYFDVTDTLV